MDRIRQARKARKLSQNAVADEIGMPRSSYAVSEKTGNFSIDELKKIYKFLDISDDPDEKKPDNQNDYLGRFINRLDDDLKELKTRQILLEKMLLELQESLKIAHSRQKASFAVTYLIAEELATVPKAGKDHPKLVMETRKKIESRLMEIKPGDK